MTAQVGVLSRTGWVGFPGPNRADGLFVVTRAPLIRTRATRCARESTSGDRSVNAQAIPGTPLSKSSSKPDARRVHELAREHESGFADVRRSRVKMIPQLGVLPASGTRIRRSKWKGRHQCCRCREVRFLRHNASPLWASIRAARGIRAVELRLRASPAQATAYSRSLGTPRT